MAGTTPRQGRLAQQSAQLRPSCARLRASRRLHLGRFLVERRWSQRFRRAHGGDRCVQTRLAPPARTENLEDGVFQAGPGLLLARRPVGRRFLEERRDPVGKTHVEIRLHRSRCGHGIVHVPQEHRHRRVGFVEGSVADHELVCDDARRIEIRPRADAFRHRLLRSHVRRRADRRARRREEAARCGLVVRLRNAKVRNLDSTLRRDQKVLGLEVAMDDSPARRMGEPGQQPLHHTRDLGEGQFVNQWPERASRHVLHRDERRALVLEVLVHGDDVRMAQRAGPTELAQEPLRERRVRRVEGAELLERHMAVKIDLPREVDRSRATAPDLAQDLVPADASAEHHLPRTMVDGRHERKAPDPRDPRDHPSEWTVKDSNAPANRHFLARVGAPVGHAVRANGPV